MTDPRCSVPLLDFQRVPEADKAAYREAFARVLDSGYFILGPEVQAFEREAADYLGVDHALGVSSGTDALLLAMMALGIGPGDEVLCPTYTFFASAGTIWRLGARPVFVDSQPCCYNMCPLDLASKITERSKAIMPVHLYGQAADMEAILAVARQHDLPVIEDAAQAIGAECSAGRAGAMGTVGCFSFYPTKNLSGFGDGGLVTTGDQDLLERMDSLRIHGHGPKYYHKHVGGNFRMDAIQGALLRLRLPQIDAMAARRRDNAAFYTEALVAADVGVVQPSMCNGASEFEVGGRIGLPVTCTVGHTFNQFVIRIPERLGRDAFKSRLAERNIGSEIYYPLCLHQQECFAELGYAVGDFPVAEAAAASTLALPIFPELRESELQAVVDALVAAAQES